jgi:hypothetical protein
LFFTRFFYALLAAICLRPSASHCSISVRETLIKTRIYPPRSRSGNIVPKSKKERKGNVYPQKTYSTAANFADSTLWLNFFDFELISASLEKVGFVGRGICYE